MKAPSVDLGVTWPIDAAEPLGAAVILVMFPLITGPYQDRDRDVLAASGLACCSIFQGNPLLAEVGYDNATACATDIYYALRFLEDRVRRRHQGVLKISAVYQLFDMCLDSLSPRMRESLVRWVEALKVDGRSANGHALNAIGRSLTTKPPTDEKDVFSACITAFRKRCTEAERRPCLQSFDQVEPTLLVGIGALIRNLTDRPRENPESPITRPRPVSPPLSSPRLTAPPTTAAPTIPSRQVEYVRPGPMLTPELVDLAQPMWVEKLKARVDRDPGLDRTTLDSIWAAVNERGTSKESPTPFSSPPWTGSRICSLPAGATWFIGDLHGDLRALEAALLVAEERDKQPTIVLLGDLIDDGEHSHAVVERVLRRWSQNPSSTVIIAGNHDVALKAHDNGTFSSEVEPSDYSEWLNSTATDLQRETARAFSALVQRAPCALRLPDGLLAVHGGVPHVDRHDAIRATNSLESPSELNDFVWLRVAPRAKKRIPNRTVRSCELGADDIVQFRNLIQQVWSLPISGLIRGHDHLENRFELHPAHREVPVLTINTLSRRLPREITGPLERMPCIARWTPGAIPTVYRLKLMPDPEGLASSEVTGG